MFTMFVIHLPLQSICVLAKFCLIIWRNARKLLKIVNEINWICKKIEHSLWRRDSDETHTNCHKKHQLAVFKHKSWNDLKKVSTQKINPHSMWNHLQQAILKGCHNNSENSSSWITAQQKTSSRVKNLFRHLFSSLKKIQQNYLPQKPQQIGATDFHSGHSNSKQTQHIAWKKPPGSNWKNKQKSKLKQQTKKLYKTSTRKFDWIL